MKMKVENTIQYNETLNFSPSKRLKQIKKKKERKEVQWWGTAPVFLFCLLLLKIEKPTEK